MRRVVRSILMPGLLVVAAFLLGVSSTSFVASWVDGQSVAAAEASPSTSASEEGVQPEEALAGAAAPTPMATVGALLPFLLSGGAGVGVAVGAVKALSRYSKRKKSAQSRGISDVHRRLRRLEGK